MFRKIGQAFNDFYDWLYFMADRSGGYSFAEKLALNKIIAKVDQGADLTEAETAKLRDFEARTL